MLTIKYEGQAVQTALAKMLQAVNNPAPVLDKIGFDLVQSTRARFAAGQAPDGTPWAPKSPVTLARHPRGGTRPLIGESRHLSGSSIAHQVQGKTLMVGSVAIYSGVHQFGAKAGSLWRGRDKRGRRAQAPWGDIPARPFLGISPVDEASILDVVRQYLTPK